MEQVINSGDYFEAFVRYSYYQVLYNGLFCLVYFSDLTFIKGKKPGVKWYSQTVLCCELGYTIFSAGNNRLTEVMAETNAKNTQNAVALVYS